MDGITHSGPSSSTSTNNLDNLPIEMPPGQSDLAVPQLRLCYDESRLCQAGNENEPGQNHSSLPLYKPGNLAQELLGILLSFPLTPVCSHRRVRPIEQLP